MTHDQLVSAYRIALACVLAAAIVLLTGCANTMEVLKGADAACADVEVDGYFTDSRARGRIVKLPEGQELTPELAEVLCQ